MLLVFDVQETLLDVGALDPFLSDVLSAPGEDARRAWFDRMLRSSFAITATGGYESFGVLAGAALRDLAAERGWHVSDAHVARLAVELRRLPAHPDVAPALRRLRNGGHRIVTLTNSVLAVAQDQLAFSGLADLVDEAYSADEVQRHKPAAEPYRMVLERERVSSAVLVAAHDWDVAGAAAAGLDTAFVARGGLRPFSAVAAPTYVAEDLSALADLLDAATTGPRTA